jgi:hypothetical protein
MKEKSNSGTDAKFDPGIYQSVIEPKPMQSWVGLEHKEVGRRLRKDRPSAKARN